MNEILGVIVLSKLYITSLLNSSNINDGNIINSFLQKYEESIEQGSEVFDYLFAFSFFIALLAIIGVYFVSKIYDLSLLASAFIGFAIVILIITLSLIGKYPYYYTTTAYECNIKPATYIQNIHNAMQLIE